MHTGSDTSADTARPAARSHLLDVAVIIAAFGIVPVALGVALPWQVLGLTVGAVFAVHGARRMWREAFSTRSLVDDAAG